MLINKKTLIYFFLIFSLLVGFYFQENSSGGAKIDFGVLFPFIKNFTDDFKTGFEIYMSNSSTLLHSPVFYIIISFLLRFLNELIYVNLIYILISASLPYLLFQIIKQNYKINNDYIFYLSLIIFISPYFRSSSIWLLGDNLSLIFFSLSIIYFNKSCNFKNEISNFFLCLFFLILCSYIRYYYAIFSIYYLLIFFNLLNKKNFINLLLFSFFLSLPALGYFYFIFQNYNFLGTINNFGKFNIYSNMLIILSITLFYIIPIIFTERSLILNYLNKNKGYFLTIFSFLITIYLIDLSQIVEIIDFSPRGGGIFLKLSQYFNLNEKLFMTVISFFSIISLDYLFQNNKLRNYLIFLILILSLPLFTLYQKYLDPLIFLILFGLIKSNILKEIIYFEKIGIKFYLIYFFSFYLFSLVYYSNIS